MGFGHRIYKEASDPRAMILKQQLIDTFGKDNDIVQLLLQIEKHGLEALKSKSIVTTNIDFWAAGAFTLMGIPSTLVLSNFALARLPGWVAHYNEQRKEGRLIRPDSHYVGEPVGEQTNCKISKNPVGLLVRKSSGTEEDDKSNTNFTP